MNQLFSPKQVAEALNVSESSIKRWCDRGLIETVRTGGGHRRIPLAGLTTFLTHDSRELANPQALGLSTTSLAVETPEVEVEARATGDTMERFSTALAAGDAEACRQLLRFEYARSGGIAAVADGLLAPTLHRFGEEWDCGRLDVYQERRACEICQELLIELEHVIPAPDRGAPLAVGAAPSGDQYRLPTKLVELTLRECGWHARSLGSNLPLASLAAAVKELDAALVWLSVSFVEQPERFAEEYDKFVSALPEETIVVVGGRALEDDLRPKLQYTAHCDNLTALSSLAKTLLRQGMQQEA